MSLGPVPGGISAQLSAFLQAIAQTAFVRLFGVGQLVSFTTHAVAGTEFSVGHSLGTPPAYYIVLGQAASGSLYDGTTANTSTTFYFRSSAAAANFRVLLVKGGA